MSDDTENETLEIDPAHPWVQASTVMTPQPIPCGVELDACTFKMSEDAEPTRAAMLNIVDPTGVKNVFLPPELVVYLFKEAAEILEEWQREDGEDKPSIILGNDHNLAAAKAASKSHRHLKGI